MCIEQSIFVHATRVKIARRVPYYTTIFTTDTRQTFVGVFTTAVSLVSGALEVLGASDIVLPTCPGDCLLQPKQAAVNVVGCAFTADGTLPIVLARPPDRLMHATTLYLPDPRNSDDVAVMSGQKEASGNKNRA